MFSPFKLVAELISFVFQIAFLYGLALIFVIGLFIVVVSSADKKEWNGEQERIEYIKKVYPKHDYNILPFIHNKEICYAIAGCRVNPDTGKLIK
jgi:hypothetical protein